MTAQRFEAVNKLLKKHGADRVLITDSVTVRYFSSFSSSNAVLLYSPKERFLFTDFRYKTSAREFCKNEKARVGGAWKFIECKQGEFAKNVGKILKNGAKKVLVQDNRLSLAEFEVYENEKNVKAANVKFVKCGKEIDEIFSVKTEEEIACIKEAARIGDRAVEKWLKKLYAGISEFEAARLLEIEALKKGSEKAAFDTIVLFGKNTALVHGVPSKERKLKNGDFILCDFGCTVNGFRSDMTRTFCFGKAKSEHKKIYDTVLQAQIIGIGSVKEGVKAKDIDKKVRGFISESGFGKYFGHATGHSVGLRIHEKPALSERDGAVLRAGTVITVEPGIYLPDEVGVRIEDTVVVRENGCEIITETIKKFVSIGR